MDRLPKNSQLERERAAYRHLNALDTGDIDDIITTLQQATYDASLEQMVLEAHQAYFQEEEVEKALLENTETIEVPALGIIPLPPVQNKKPFNRKHRSARWIWVLAALLIIGALLGSFIALFGIYRSSLSSPSKTTVPQPSVCQPYPLKQFDISIQEISDSLNSLEGMTTISENDAWAVGYSFNAPLVPQDMRAFTTHWDGKSWRVVPSANRNGKKTALEAVAAVSANDVWAVGYSYASLPGSAQSDQTLIEHWDGKTWRQVAVPALKLPPSLTRIILSDVISYAGHQIWIAGFANDSEGVYSSSFILGQRTCP